MGAATISYNRENYKKIRAEYADKPHVARAAADAKRDELWKKVPGVAEIDKLLSATGLKIFSLAGEGRVGLDEKLAALKAENKALRDERARLLKEAGYPADYSDIVYECNICNDTGFCDGQMCGCMKKALILAGYESSGIGDLIRTQSFENFSLDYYKGEARTIAEHIFSRMKHYAETFSEKKSENILFIGNTGLGKTHLSTATAKVIIDRGYDVVYDSAQNIFFDFENERFHSARDTEMGQATERYFDCDLLIIDDLGTEISSAFTVSCLYNIINTRQNRNKATIISTNLDSGELRRRYSDRITSRIFGEFFPFFFKGDDIRSQKIKK
ncbi:MAG: ATP-binding protein [Clostridia bacterium]|nr:ATP-binding protein [Clostridia bacterium]